MLRRLLALVVFASMLASTAESVMAFDGTAPERHKTAGVALTNGGTAAQVDADVGQQSTPEAPQRESHHRHGGLADHCTHSHLAALMTPTRSAPMAMVHRDPIETVVTTYADADLRRALRPPKA